jgi:hypothetical protein
LTLQVRRLIIDSGVLPHKYAIFIVAKRGPEYLKLNESNLIKNVFIAMVIFTEDNLEILAGRVDVHCFKLPCCIVGLRVIPY